MKVSRVRASAVTALGLSLTLMVSACGGSEESSGAPDAESSEVSVEEPTPAAPEPEASADAEEQAEEQLADDEDQAAEEAPATVDEAVLRMAIWDETSSGLHPRFEVWIRGTGSWFASQDLLLEEAGPFPTGEPASFFIYPEGRDTPEIEVQLVVPATVIPGSVRDLIEIEVYDDEIIVFGTSVPDFSATYPR